MSAPCIYHDDQPSVTLCPGCDFGVCQKCMDEGNEGVCSTCAEERAVRRETSQIQREYEVAAAVRRCNYCRVGEDEETALDDEGYCEACRVLPRCGSHAELIAVGHCKGCRQEYCRKCLGFTDICQACAAKQKGRPKKPQGASGGPQAGATAGKSPAGARKKKPSGGEEPARKKKRPPPSAAGKAEEKPKKRPSRGEAVLKDKLQAKSAGKVRMQVLAVALVGALTCILLASGMWMRAQSPEEQAKRVQEQMIQVHKAVVYYQKVMGRLPTTEEDIYRALGTMKVPNYRSIRVGTSSADVPGGVVYTKRDQGFLVTGADHQGQPLRDDRGILLYMDQFTDSSGY